ncbi:MAG: NAD(P) transhydrogenase subunit alpha [Bryobacterales bacterium]|nr:NAD(P) transhydrogenase subunit alpha [Bryobacterales bacterium]
MVIGIPREILENEYRVAALPETVAEYVRLGFSVLVESGAGQGAYRPDQEYASAGAEIVPSAEALYSRSDLILKVKQPCFNRVSGKHEAEMIRRGSMLITFLHPAAPANHEIVEMLRERNITALTMDSIPRISRAQPMDALTSMSTITGYRSTLIAAMHLPKFVPMIGMAVGTTKPARFLIIGAGVVGLQAIATVKRLGGVVEALDIRPAARQAAQSLGAKVAGFDMPPHLAVDGADQAQPLPAEWLERERAAILPLLEKTDVVISSALVPGQVAPVLITESMVAAMKPGSVIVDVAIDQGGNCACTRPGSEYSAHGVFVCGILNIPGAMPVHASWLYSSNVLEFVKHLFRSPDRRPDLDDELARPALVTHAGRLLHQGAIKAMSMAHHTVEEEAQCLTS